MNVPVKKIAKASKPATKRTKPSTVLDTLRINVTKAHRIQITDVDRQLQELAKDLEDAPQLLPVAKEEFFNANTFSVSLRVTLIHLADTGKADSTAETLAMDRISSDEMRRVRHLEVEFPLLLTGIWANNRPPLFRSAKTKDFNVSLDHLPELCPHLETLTVKVQNFADISDAAEVEERLDLRRARRRDPRDSRVLADEQTTQMLAMQRVLIAVAAVSMPSAVLQKKIIFHQQRNPPLKETRFDEQFSTSISQLVGDRAQYGLAPGFHRTREAALYCAIRNLPSKLIESDFISVCGPLKESLDLMTLKQCGQDDYQLLRRISESGAAEVALS